MVDRRSLQWLARLSRPWYEFGTAEAVLAFRFCRLCFSAFHYYSISMDSQVNDLPGPLCKQSKSGNFFNTYTLMESHL